MGLHRLATVVAVAVAAAAMIPASSAQLAPDVAIIGCSNSGLVGEAYFAYSTRDAAWSAAQGTYALKEWATATAWTTSSSGVVSNPPFDKQLAQRGQPSAVWYPVCIRNKDYKGTLAKQQGDAWNDFLRFYTLLRARTQVPLWLTDRIGDQPTCPLTYFSMMTYIVDRAVSEGYAQRSEPDIPPASNPDKWGCHFDPVLSTNVGAAAAAFIDG